MAAAATLPLQFLLHARQLLPRFRQLGSLSPRLVAQSLRFFLLLIQFFFAAVEPFPLLLDFVQPAEELMLHRVHLAEYLLQRALQLGATAAQFEHRLLDGLPGNHGRVVCGYSRHNPCRRPAQVIPLPRDAIAERPDRKQPVATKRNLGQIRGESKQRIIALELRRFAEHSPLGATVGAEVLVPLNPPVPLIRRTQGGETGHHIRAWLRGRWSDAAGRCLCQPTNDRHG